MRGHPTAYWKINANADDLISSALRRMRPFYDARPVRRRRADTMALLCAASPSLVHGVTEAGHVVVVLVPIRLVLLLVLSHQNYRGTRKM